MDFENEKDAEDALKELKGKELCGRPLNVCKYISFLKLSKELPLGLENLKKVDSFH